MSDPLLYSSLSRLSSKHCLGYSKTLSGERKVLRTKSRNTIQICKPAPHVVAALSAILPNRLSHRCEKTITHAESFPGEVLSHGPDEAASNHLKRVSATREDARESSKSAPRHNSQNHAITEPPVTWPAETPQVPLLRTGKQTHFHVSLYLYAIFFGCCRLFVEFCQLFQSAAAVGLTLVTKAVFQLAVEGYESPILQTILELGHHLCLDLYDLTGSFILFYTGLQPASVGEGAGWALCLLHLVTSNLFLAGAVLAKQHSRGQTTTANVPPLPGRLMAAGLLCEATRMTLAGSPMAGTAGPLYWASVGLAAATCGAAVLWCFQALQPTPTPASYIAAANSLHLKLSGESAEAQQADNVMAALGLYTARVLLNAVLLRQQESRIIYATALSALEAAVMQLRPLVAWALTAGLLWSLSRDSRDAGTLGGKTLSQPAEAESGGRPGGQRQQQWGFLAMAAALAAINCYTSLNVLVD